MLDRIQVFVSSSMLELEYEREIAVQAIREMSLKPWLFELEPAVSLSPIAAYLDGVRDADIFVLIVWKQLSAAVQQELHEALREGKPVLAFVRALREGEVRERALIELLEKLKGQRPTAHGCASVFKEYRSLTSLSSALHAALAHEIQERYRDPVWSVTRDEMYDLGASILQSSSRRAFVFESTPSLLLGAKPYLGSAAEKRVHERGYLDALNEWMQIARTDRAREMLYLFSSRASAHEVESKQLAANAEFVERAHERVELAATTQRETGRRVRFASVDKPFSGPLIVGDERFAVWIVGGEDAVAISQRDRKLCGVLARFLAAHARVLDDVASLEAAVGLSPQPCRTSDSPAA